MNTQQLYFYLHVIPYPGVDYLIDLLARTCGPQRLNVAWVSQATA